MLQFDKDEQLTSRSPGVIKLSHYVYCFMRVKLLFIGVYGIDWNVSYLILLSLELVLGLAFENVFVGKCFISFLIFEGRGLGLLYRTTLFFKVT